MMLDIFGNSTSPAHWVPQPVERGTWGILVSCLSTLTLALWTVLHLNIPGYGRGSIRTVNKVAWFVVGCIACEVPAFNAWREYREAKRLTREMRRILRQPEVKTSWQKTKEVLAGLIERNDKPIWQRWWAYLSNARISCAQWFEDKKRLAGSAEVEETEREQCNLPRASTLPHHSIQSHNGNHLEDIELRHYNTSSLRSYEPSSISIRLGAEQSSSDESWRSVTEGSDTDDSVPTSHRVRSRPFRNSGCHMSSSARHLWTDVHSFYVLSGGLAYDTSGAEHAFVPYNKTRLTLTRKGVLFLARTCPDLLPNLTKNHIQERSQNNAALKIIACIELTWFICQFFARWHQSLAISFLELNTFAHACCALIMFLCWMDKPLDVPDPDLLATDRHYEICALMCMASTSSTDHVISISRILLLIAIQPLVICVRRLRGRVVLADAPSHRASGSELQIGDKFGFNQFHGFGCLVDLFFWRLCPSWAHKSDTRRDLSQFRLTWRRRNIITDVNAPYPSGAFWTENDSIFCNFKVRRNRWRSIIDGVVARALTDVDRERWWLASKAISRYGIANSAQLTETVTDRAMNLPEMSSAAGKWKILAVGTGYMVAPTVYGLWHLLAWAAPFTIRAEQLLWRISAVAVASSVPLWIVFHISNVGIQAWQRQVTRERLQARRLHLRPAQNTDSINERSSHERSARIVAVIKVLGDGALFLADSVLALSVLLSVCLYIFARFYLVVECFIQLAHLPPSAFLVPQWTQYIPFIS